jgi:hypothetical protein
VPLPLDTYVFGTAIGQKVTDIKRAWMTAVLRAHDHRPTFTATANLSPESRAALAAIDLHLHDLRREAGSRWLEGGVPLHTIREWLGHTSIAQTSTYLAGTIKTQHDAMTAFETRRAALQQTATDATNRGEKATTICHAEAQQAQQIRPSPQSAHHVSQFRDRGVGGSNPLAPTSSLRSVPDTCGCRLRSVNASRPQSL